MKTTEEVPTSWLDLQNKVCKYLNQCGYHAESPKTIEMVRGKVEIDVFVTTDDESLPQFVCECKYWETPVPQEKVHAFRTVVQDSGSMLGIFISKAGFQKGAIEAADKSNVLLKDWDGFVKMISRKWAKNRFDEIIKLCAPLSVYTDPLDVPIDNFDKEKQEKYYQLKKKYDNIYMLVRELELGLFPQKESVVIEGIQFDDLNSLFDYLGQALKMATEEFETLFEGNPVEEWKLNASRKMLFESCILDYLDTDTVSKSVSDNKNGLNITVYF